MAPKTKPQKNLDISQLAHRVVDWATMPKEDRPPEAAGPRQKDQKKVAAGRKGGLKGGKIRAKNLSKERRKQIATDAAATLWRNNS